jgi:hypothetical protein
MLFLECLYRDIPHAVPFPAEIRADVEAYLNRHGADCEWRIVPASDLPCTAPIHQPTDLWNPGPLRGAWKIGD